MNVVAILIGEYNYKLTKLKDEKTNRLFSSLLTILN